MEKKLCAICGKEIEDLQTLPAKVKYCRSCRRERSGLRPANIKVLAEYDGVIFNKSGIVFSKETEPRKNQKYIRDIFIFGGPDYESWGGLRYTTKAIVYVDKGINEGDVVRILLCSKEHIDANGKTYVNNYLSIAKSKSKEPPKMKMVYDRGYYKTTLKGYGRDRHVSLATYTGSEMIKLLSNSTGCRSGRYGSNERLALVDIDAVKIEDPNNVY